MATATKNFVLGADWQEIARAGGRDALLMVDCYGPFELAIAEGERPRPGVAGHGITDAFVRQLRGAEIAWARGTGVQVVATTLGSLPGYEAVSAVGAREEIRTATATAAGVVGDAQAAAQEAQASADRVDLGALDQAVSTSTTAAGTASTAAAAAATARDAAFGNANVYPDIATGRAAVADGAQFMVPSGDAIVRYRRDSDATQTELARYPNAVAVSRTAALGALAANYAAAFQNAGAWHDKSRAQALIGNAERVANGLILGLSSDALRVISDGKVARAYDFSGANNHTVEDGSTRHTSVGADGRWVFSGSGSGMRFAEGALRNTVFSFDIVFQIDADVTTDASIFSLGNASTTIRGWRLYYSAANRSIRFEYRTAAGLRASGFVGVTLGIPLRATVAFQSGVGFSLYLNGALVGTFPSADELQPADPASRRAYIAAHDLYSANMKGAVWRVLFWNRVLTEREVADLEANLAPETAVPVGMQPFDFVLDGVLDNSKIPDWIPAAARPALTPIGGVVFDGAGAYLEDGRQLRYNLPSATGRFAFGFSFRPKAARSSKATWLLAMLEGEARTAGLSIKGARIRIVGGSPSILFENYTDGVTLTGKANLDWAAGDLVECYIASDGDHIHWWLRSYRPLDGEKIEVWTTKAPTGWRVYGISFGGPGGSIGTANSVFERVQIAQPAYHKPSPDDYFNRKVKGDPVFNINFDDGFASDVQAAGILEKYGARGTFFIVGNWANQKTAGTGRERHMTWNQIRDLHARGHDIQCHTFSHPTLATLTDAQVRAEFEQNDAVFAAQGLPRPRIHAYPFNSYSQSVRNITLEYRDLARSVTLGLDSYAPNHGALRTLRLDGNNGQEPFPGVLFNAANMRHFIDQLCRNGGIGSVLFHEIAGPPSGDFDPATFEYFEEIVEYAARRVKIKTFSEILKDIGPREMHGPYRT